MSSQPAQRKPPRSSPLPSSVRRPVRVTVRCHHCEGWIYKDETVEHVERDCPRPRPEPGR
ncbi:hypothetical protein ACTWP5_31685 [Streptomyces sp. 4N509B]|uniref:hypothetical protein n=1 Tax=Streptomyces sp. 4N509B TaxID=3457413 RepID=UPI003FD31228